MLKVDPLGLRGPRTHDDRTLPGDSSPVPLGTPAEQRVNGSPVAGTGPAAESAAVSVDERLPSGPTPV
jgi:hypothetical protein